MSIEMECAYPISSDADRWNATYRIDIDFSRARSAKKLTPESVKKLIDEGPYTAKAAQGAGLIDRVAYPEQFENSLKMSLRSERIHVTKHYGQSKPEDMDLSSPFALFKLLTRGIHESRSHDRTDASTRTGVPTPSFSCRAAFPWATANSTMPLLEISVTSVPGAASP